VEYNESYGPFIIKQFSVCRLGSEGTHILLSSGLAAGRHCGPVIWCIECNTTVT